MYHAHNYEVMTKENRPQDENMDGNDWTFETLEHGGEYPDMMPQAIRAWEYDFEYKEATHWMNLPKLPSNAAV